MGGYPATPAKKGEARGYRPDVVALLARIDAERAGNLRTDANR
jgi:hypothetical protein